MYSLYPIILPYMLRIHDQMQDNERMHRVYYRVAELSGKSAPVRFGRDGHKIQLTRSCSRAQSRPFYEVMASCYWAQPAQLHPWYKPATLKRKLPAMLPRSESPFPLDEYDSDSRVKRQRRITLDQTRSRKRNLPSPPQSPINESGDQRLPKRQRCTTLEFGIEGLSLNPRAPAAPQAPGFAARRPAPVSAVLAHVPDFSPQWPEMSLPTHSSYPISSPSPPPFTPIPFTSASARIPPTPATIADPHAVPDVKMHTSSWYEPEKDRTCFVVVVVGGGGSARKRSLTRMHMRARRLYIGIVVTDLDVSSDDEADVVDGAPKLPRAVLEALLRGPERDSPLGGLLHLPPQLSQSLVSPPLLDPARISEVDEAMDVEK
jgi:hypothetical protein